MEDHLRFDYSPIVDRQPFRLPKKERVALWVIPNIEHFHFDKPSISIEHATKHLVPDVLNYSWRDYGNRVGVWRLMELLEKHGIRGTAALNSEVCQHYPRIVEEGKKLGWEWMGHGRSNSQLIANMREEDERALIKDVVHTIEEATGSKPKGWLGAALTETHNTLDILAEEGIEYVGDWVNDEQPYPIRTKSRTIFSIPYSIEMNDITIFLESRKSGQDFYQTIVDQFDGLYEDGAKNARVMAICLHPFLVGHPHRSKYLDKALQYITSHKDVWLATGSEIIQHYKQSYMQSSL